MAGIGDIPADSAPETISTHGCVRVENATAPVTVYSLDGRIVARAEASESVEIGLPAGAYAVRCGTGTAKGHGQINGPADKANGENSIGNS